MPHLSLIQQRPGKGPWVARVLCLHQPCVQTTLGHRVPVELHYRLLHLLSWHLHLAAADERERLVTQDTYQVSSRTAGYLEVLPTVGGHTSTSLQPETVFHQRIHLYYTILIVATIRLNWQLSKHLSTMKTSLYSTNTQYQTYRNTNYPLIWQQQYIP